MAPIEIESATKTRQMAARITEAGEGRRDTGLPNPDESHLEATMMTRNKVAPMIAGDGRRDTGLPNPDNHSAMMMTQQTAPQMTSAQRKVQGLPNPPM